MNGATSTRNARNPDLCAGEFEEKPSDVEVKGGTQTCRCAKQK